MTYKIEWNKEYFRERFRKVFNEPEWSQTFYYGLDKEHQDKLIDDLMKCFEEKE